MSKKHGNCIWKFNFFVSLLSLFVFGWLPRNPPFMFSKRFNYVSKKIRLRWSPFSLKTMLYHQLVWVRCLMLLAWGNSGSQFLKCQKMVEIGQQLILWSRKISAYLFSLFTSNSTKEASEGISYQWNYIVENQCKPNFLLLLWNFRGLRIHFY